MRTRYKIMWKSTIGAAALMALVSCNAFRDLDDIKVADISDTVGDSTTDTGQTDAPDGADSDTATDAEETDGDTSVDGDVSEDGQTGDTTDSVDAPDTTDATDTEVDIVEDIDMKPTFCESAGCDGDTTTCNEEAQRCECNEDLVFCDGATDAYPGAGDVCFSPMSAEHCGTCEPALGRNRFGIDPDTCFTAEVGTRGHTVNECIAGYFDADGDVDIHDGNGCEWRVVEDATVSSFSGHVFLDAEESETGIWVLLEGPNAGEDDELLYYAGGDFMVSPAKATLDAQEAHNSLVTEGEFAAVVVDGDVLVQRADGVSLTQLDYLRHRGATTLAKIPKGTVPNSLFEFVAIESDTNTGSGKIVWYAVFTQGQEPGTCGIFDGYATCPIDTQMIGVGATAGTTVRLGTNADLWVAVAGQTSQEVKIVGGASPFIGVSFATGAVYPALPSYLATDLTATDQVAFAEMETLNVMDYELDNGENPEIRNANLLFQVGMSSSIIHDIVALDGARIAVATNDGVFIRADTAENTPEIRLSNTDNTQRLIYRAVEMAPDELLVFSDDGIKRLLLEVAP